MYLIAYAYGIAGEFKEVKKWCSETFGRKGNNVRRWDVAVHEEITASLKKRLIPLTQVHLYVVSASGRIAPGFSSDSLD
jgi:hypothetical protein